MDQSKKKLVITRKRLWLLWGLIPFGIFFGIGARFGYWFIEKDAGRWLRDTGKIVGQRDFVEAALIYGFIAGGLGTLVGLGFYGVYVLVKRMQKN